MLKASVSYDPTEIILIACLLKYNFYSNLCACHIIHFKTLSINDLVIYSTLYFQSCSLNAGTWRNRDLIPFRPSACSHRSNSSQWHLMGFMFVQANQVLSHQTFPQRESVVRGDCMAVSWIVCTC